MYAIRVTKTIWTAPQDVVEAWRDRLPSDSPKAPRCAEFARDLELPFPPYPGLSLTTSEWHCGPLETVQWIVEEKRFLCAVVEEYSLEASEFREHLEAASGGGWSRSGGDAPGWVRGILSETPA
jgi:hypothetical protein